MGVAERETVRPEEQQSRRQQPAAVFAGDRSSVELAAGDVRGVPCDTLPLARGGGHWRGG